MITLRETIRALTTRHLDAGYLVMGQCLSAVGWVGGTLPERQDMTELPCSDVAGAGFVVGAALAGKRPIYVVRYQGFQWLNAPLIVNYAAKSKALWGRPCPMLIRSIAMEGGIGPVAGSSHHSLFLRMPGVKIYSPMTPYEWQRAYEDFMSGDDVVYLSEHRKAWDNTKETTLRSFLDGPVDIILFPISITHFAAFEAAKELCEDRPFHASVKEAITVGVRPISQIKPLTMSKYALAELISARYGGIVLDDDYPNGTAKAIAQDLHNMTGARMYTMGLEERTAGFAAEVDNLPPNKDQIKNFIKEIVK